MNRALLFLLLIGFALPGCTDSEVANTNGSNAPPASDDSTDPVGASDAAVPKVNADNQEQTVEIKLTEQQVLRLFEGEWYPNWIESAKYENNSDHISELGHYFDDNVNPFYETSVVFYDYGITWSRKQTATSEPENERIKLNQNGSVNWSEHVDSINNDQIAIRSGSVWIVCDHWSTKK